MSETKKKENTETIETARENVTPIKPVRGEAPPKQEESPTEKEESSVWETVVGAAAKVAEASGEIVKSSAEKVGNLTTRTAHLAKLKLEVRSLRHDLEKIYRETGEKLWQLHTEKTLEGIDAHFAEDFKKIEEITRNIQAKETGMED